LGLNGVRETVDAPDSIFEKVNRLDHGDTMTGPMMTKEAENGDETARIEVS